MKKQKFIEFFKKLVFAGFAFIAFFTLVFQFQNVQASASIQDLDVLGVKCIVGGNGCLVEQAADFLLNAAIPLAILVIMWGGYKYFLSGLVEGQSDGKKTIQAGVIGLIIVLIARAITALIQGSVNANGFTAAALTPFVNNLTDFLFGLAAVVTALVIVWGGYKYLFAGLPGEQKDGKDTIRNGVVGLIVVLLARGIADVIKRTINGEATLTLQTDPIVNFIKIFLSGFFIPIVSVVTVVFFVLAGYYLITANGNESMVTKGKDAIRNAVIGLIIVLLATTIAQLVVSFFPSGASGSGSTTSPSPTTPPTTPPGGTNPIVSPTR